MIKKAYGIFEVDSVKPRKLRNGNRLQIIIEAPLPDASEENGIMEFMHLFGERVKVNMEIDDSGQKEMFDDDGNPVDESEDE